MEQQQSISFENFKTLWWALTVADGIAFLLVARYGYSWYCHIKGEDERRKFFSVMTAFAAVGVVMIVAANYFDTHLARLVPHAIFAAFLYSFLYAAHRATDHMKRLHLAPRASREAISETEKVFESVVRPLLRDEPVRKRDIRHLQNVELNTRVALK